METNTFRLKDAISLKRQNRCQRCCSSLATISACFTKNSHCQPHRQPNGTIVGDPAQTELTKICQHFGWQGKGTQFDVLPLIIQMPFSFAVSPSQILIRFHQNHKVKVA